MPPAHSAIAFAITLTLFAQLLLVDAYLLQFPAFTPIGRPALVKAMVARLYSDASRPNINILRESRGSA